MSTLQLICWLFLCTTYLMSTDYLLKETLRAFFLPPGLLILILAVGLVFWRLIWGKMIAVAGLLLFWLLTLPVTASLLMAQIEAPPLSPDLSAIDAIVCLGGGKRSGAYDVAGGETVNNETLARLRQTARLARQIGKPVLVTGGAPSGGRPEADLMAETLAQDFATPVRWIENRANDTRDNATQSAAILLPQRPHILLISSAYHLRRAERAFMAAGFQVTLAPTDYANREPLRYLSFLPRSSSFYTSTTALRELIGLLWYRLRQ